MVEMHLPEYSIARLVNEMSWSKDPAPVNLTYLFIHLYSWQEDAACIRSLYLKYGYPTAHVDYDKHLKSKNNKQ